MEKRRKIIFAGIVAVLLIITMTAGCEAQKEKTQGLRFVYSTKPDVETDYARAREAWGWFFVEELPTEGEPVAYDGDDYYKVKDDGLKSVADLKNYLGFLFSEDIVREIMSQSPYKDIDGQLYVHPQDQGNQIKAEAVSTAAIQSDGVWSYTVSMNLTDSGDETKSYGTKEFEFLYEKEDGHWVFTSFPQPSGPNRIKQSELRTVGDSLKEIKTLLRTTMKAFQRSDYDTLLGLMRDEAIHDKTTLLSYRTLVTEQFGDDAWLNTAYIITDLTEPDGEFNVCKVALSFNGKSESVLGYRDFYFYITDQYGSWKLEDVCSFSFDPYYDGQKKPNYFAAKEATYRGIHSTTTEKQLQDKFGAPIELTGSTAEGSVTYVYEDAEYRFARTGSGEAENIADVKSVLEQITVYAGESATIRGIRLGDSFDDTIKLFPIEKDYKKEPLGLLYGQDTQTGQGGYLDDDLMILTSETIAPFVKIEFVNGSVNRIHYVMRQPN